ncbi:DUF3352 domain-containing protein [Demequina sp.]|uniref:variant leucine-rich repeat-containing protein n=1 Tax=Demequina sp. TaxID=2050685 RepID=UPI0025C2E572|nr:DUF3352 domain-containing protein [Demequina sp.]
MGNAAPLSQDEAVRLLAKSDTPAAALSAIAAQHPHLHPLVDVHPQCYEGLRIWMAQYGPAAARAAQEPPVASAPVATNAPAVVPATASESAEVIAPRPGRSHKRLVTWIAVGAIGLAGLGGAGAYALSYIMSDGFASATESAEALPSSTYWFAELSIDPSDNQKLEMKEILENMPGLTAYIERYAGALDEADYGADFKHYVWDALFASETAPLETSLDYATDIEPWLGTRITLAQFGYVHTDDGTTRGSEMLVAIEASNPGKGAEVLQQLFEDDLINEIGWDRPVAHARDGYVIVTADTVDIDELYSGGSLGDSAALKGMSDQLGSRGLLTVWAQPRAALEARLALIDAAGPGSNEISMSQENVDWIRDATVATIDAIPADASHGLVLRATDGSLELLQVATAATAPTPSADGGAMSAAGTLPDDVMATVAVSDAGLLAEAFISPLGYYQANAGAVSFASIPLGGTFFGYYDPEPQSGDFPPTAAPVVGPLIPSGLYSPEDALWSLTWLDGDPEQFRADWEDAIDYWLNVSVPDGLNDALGEGVVVAVDRQLRCNLDDIDNYYGECAEPRAAVVVHSDDMDATRSLVADVDRENWLFENNISATISRDDSRIAYSRGGYGATLVEIASSPLAEDSAYTRALPRADGAEIIGFVHIDDLVRSAQDQGAEFTDDQWNILRDLEAVGFSFDLQPGGTTVTRITLTSDTGA